MDTITLHEVYLKKGVHLHRQQIGRVGVKASKLYEQIMGESPTKTEVKEYFKWGKRTKGFMCKVCVYPAEFASIISNLLDEEIAITRKKEATFKK